MCFSAPASFLAAAATAGIGAAIARCAELLRSDGEGSGARVVVLLTNVPRPHATMPRALARKYAFCDILGPRGPVVAENLVLGFVLFAPKTTYPQHSHADIEESYVSISGACNSDSTSASLSECGKGRSILGASIFAVGSSVRHPSLTR